MKRVYNGTESESLNGPCLKWPNELDSSPQMVNHSFCRKPNDEHNLEYCFTSKNETSSCDVITCGKERNVLLDFALVAKSLQPI